MCISAAPATFSATKIYVGEANLNNKYIHVIAYQNAAQSRYAEEPNAMILPFPTKTSMNEQNIINTSLFKSFLSDITNSTKISSRSLSSRSLMDYKDALVFDSGSYTVVLADHVRQIPKALEKVSSDKRPTLPYRLLAGFGKLYPDQPIALCCWKGGVEAEPLLWWYEPKDKDSLFITTMDAHDGNSPNLEAVVETDHIVSIGSSLLKDTYSRMYNRVDYSGHIPGHIKQILPNYVYGARLPQLMKNGDLFIKIADLRSADRANIPEIKRGTDSSNTFAKVAMRGWH